MVYGSGNTSVNSLQSAEAFLIAGGTLTLTGPSVLSAGLTIEPRATLVTDGPAASLVWPGKLNQAGAVLAETRVDGYTSVNQGFNQSLPALHDPRDSPGHPGRWVATRTFIRWFVVFASI